MQLWAQARETPEGFLGSLTPIMESVQRERGYTFDYAHKGSLSLAEWRKRGQPPYPAVVAFHDHGAYFYFGKEKVVEVNDEHASLTAFKKTYYGGKMA